MRQQAAVKGGNVWRQAIVDGDPGGYNELHGSVARAIHLNHGGEPEKAPCFLCRRDATAVLHTMYEEGRTVSRPAVAAVLTLGEQREADD